MSLSRMFFWMSASLVALVTISIIFALSAANTVSSSKAGSVTSAITVNQLKPSECAGLNLTRLVVLANGDIPSDGQSELIIVSSGKDTIDNSTAVKPDCILGGDAKDTLYGGLGGDVLNGGPGNDQCWGGGGATTTFLNCEHIH